MSAKKLPPIADQSNPEFRPKNKILSADFGDISSPKAALHQARFGIHLGQPY
jgi:hypothetical protein